MLSLKNKINPHLVLLFILMLPVQLVCGQSWLPGYNYRKKITVNKALVIGNLNLIDFPLLVSLEDPDLSYVAGRCTGNHISSNKGRDFAFTLVNNPTVPLNYQLDHYEPGRGKLVSWVSIPSLSAVGTSAAATEIYLYYGSNTIHFPLEAKAYATWSSSINRVWHMNGEGNLASNPNAKNAASEQALHAINLSADNYIVGKIGQAINLNGLNQSLISGKDNTPNFYLSCWLKFDEINREQVIVSTDSTGVGGFVFKINEQNQLVLETRINSIVAEKVAPVKMLANQWYYVSVFNQSNKRGFYIDGNYYSSGLVNAVLKAGGQIQVGSHKMQRYLHGFIDELQIQPLDPTQDVIRTLYRNQSDPATFYTLSTEESNQSIVPTGMLFTGQINDQWLEKGNWNMKEVPADFAQVIVGENTRLRIDASKSLLLNKLHIASNAVLSLEGDLEVLCEHSIGMNSRLNLEAGSRLQLDGQVYNEGKVIGGLGTLLRFSGSNMMQEITGTGDMDLFALSINQSAKENTVKLFQKVDVRAYVQPILGKLDANSLLTLKHEEGRTAFIWPIEEVDQTGIIGEVKVEQFVPGSYPAPATARGWRLFSPPVYHGQESGMHYYHLYDYQQGLFITGPGGTSKGFDSSPLNGHTIYTHNQSTLGTLAQKYSGIPAMSSIINTGKGIYVYSRGGRNAPDAFIKQIQTAPFQNPDGYLIKHKGLLYQGSLEVELQNRNMAEAGDGFNLLGNPYAASLRWAALQKENLSPYLWKFNPLNNAYDVSDDPNILIAAGEGFFVKVLNGNEKGKLIFNENAKSTIGFERLDNDLTTVDLQKEGVNKLIQRPAGIKEMHLANSARQNAAELQVNTFLSPSKLMLTISREVFQQPYTLVFSSAGNNDFDDQDATALGSGYVSIAGLSINGEKLSVDSRSLPGRRPMEIPFYVKGWASGNYKLGLTGINSFPPDFKITLLDHYLNIKKDIDVDQVYDFEINTSIPNSFGDQRFSLHIDNTNPLQREPVLVDDLLEDKIRLYPNPVKDYLNLKLPDEVMMKLGVILRDLMGQVVFRKELGMVSGTQPATMAMGALQAGTYLMEVINLENQKRLKSFKIIKQ